MGFGLAEGCVALSERAYVPVADSIEAVQKMLSAPLEGLNMAMEDVVGHIHEMLSPIGPADGGLASLGEYQAARATEKATGNARNAPGDQQRAARNAWSSTAGRRKLPVLGDAVEHAVARHAQVEHAIHHEAAFVGLAQLAEKMQVEAARQAERAEGLALHEQQNQHLGKLAAAVSGNVVNVAIQDAGAAARPDW